MLKADGGYGEKEVQVSEYMAGARHDPTIHTERTGENERAEGKANGRKMKGAGTE